MPVEKKTDYLKVNIIFIPVFLMFLAFSVLNCEKENAEQIDQNEVEETASDIGIILTKNTVDEIVCRFYAINI